MKLLLKISFLGTNYCGYQVQPNGISVQLMLNRAAETLFGFPCDIIGCSRTDSGVHANEFVITVSEKSKGYLNTKIPIERIPLAFSAYLPEDICAFDALWVSDQFHPRYDVAQKEYLYRIFNRPVRSPFEEHRSFHIPKVITPENFLKMQEAAGLLEGTHDFTSYMAKGSKISDAVRTIYSSAVIRNGDFIEYRVRANGFLYNMVRILAGTLIAVAEGKLSPEDIPAITAAKDRSVAGSTMPPHGLYLNKVIYPKESLLPQWEGNR